MTAQKALDSTPEKKAILELEGFEERCERYKEKLKDYTIMDDIFMRNVFKKRECVEYILQVVMNKKELQLIDHILQEDYKNLQGRSAVLDCVAKDENYCQFNVEIQGANEGASPKRARYHSGLLDMNTLNPGEPFEKLPETYVIFITRNDTLKNDLPISHVKRVIKESGEIFEDEENIIYVNSDKQEDTELGRLMHDLHCKDAKDMHSDILSSRVHELKETEEGVREMCKDMEEIYSEGMEKGIERGIESGRLLGLEEGEYIGAEKKAKETVLALAEMKMPIEQIAQVVKVTVEVVQNWIGESVIVAKE